MRAGMQRRATVFVSHADLVECTEKGEVTPIVQLVTCPVSTFSIRQPVTNSGPDNGASTDRVPFTTDPVPFTTDRVPFTICNEQLGS